MMKTPNTSQEGRLIGKGNDPDGYAMSVWDDAITVDAGGSWGVFYIGFTTENTWTHLTLVFDRPDAYLYKNGDLWRTASIDSSWNTTAGMDIGRRSVNHDHYFNGKIDEIHIYDRALSAEEINETYKGKMKVKVTVRNVGSVSIPEAEFVANLKKDGTTVDSDTYTTSSSIDTGDLKTLTFYFNEMRPGGEYNINIPGIDVSQAVSCQSLE